MSTIKFKDGMEFDTSGQTYRVIRKTDGWYVVGRGSLIPVDDSEDGYRMIDALHTAEARARR